jgi:hypothetical protein
MAAMREEIDICMEMNEMRYLSSPPIVGALAKIVAELAQALLPSFVLGCGGHKD